MKKYFFSFIMILSLNASIKADWKEDLFDFYEEKEELVKAVFNELCSVSVKWVKTIPQRTDLTTTTFVAALTAAVSSVVLAAKK